MKKIFLLMFVMILTIGSFGCTSQRVIVKGSGEVQNKEDFTVAEYKADNKEIASISTASGSTLIAYSNLNGYENWLLSGRAYMCTGEAAIIRGKKIGLSESYCRIYQNGSRENKTGFTLTNIEVLDVYDGESIKKDQTSLKKGDIITVYEEQYLTTDENGNNIIQYNYESIWNPIFDDTEYILYLSRIEDGYEYRGATLNNVWLPGPDMFVLDDKTKNIKSKDDAKNLAKEESKYFCMSPKLYPVVIEKYGK